MFNFILNALWRRHVQKSHHRDWFGRDRPNRIKNGYGPDGLYPEERSAADKERVGLKDPDKRNTCRGGSCGS